MKNIQLINDHFQNFKSYGIPKAQLIIADPPYNLGVNAYASNPSWYVDGDNKKGESDKAGRAFFDTDNENMKLVSSLMNFAADVNNKIERAVKENGNRTGKDVLFESNIIILNDEYKAILRIQNAIHEVTGLRFNQYITKSRKRDGVFARMIFVYHCRKRKMKLTQIAKYVRRDHSSMLHLLRKYDDDFKYNPQFRDMATRVNNILNKTNETA